MGDNIMRHNAYTNQIRRMVFVYLIGFVIFYICHLFPFAQPILRRNVAHAAANYQAIVDGKRFSISEVESGKWIFFDEKGNPIKDFALARKLAVIAYVAKSRIFQAGFLKTNVESMDGVVKSFLKIKSWETGRDFLGRAVAAYIIYRTGLAPLPKELIGMSVRTIKDAFTDVETLVGGFGVGVAMWVEKQYGHIIDKAPALSSGQPVNYEVANEILEAFLAGYRYELPATHLVSDLSGLDKRWYNDLKAMAIKFADEFASAFPKDSDIVQAKHLVSLAAKFEQLVRSIPAGKKFYENLANQEKAVANIRSTIDLWASEACKIAQSGRSKGYVEVKNPKPETIINKIYKWATDLKIPPVVIAAMMFIESGWKHFNDDGTLNVNRLTGDVGLMQINIKEPYIEMDVEQVKKDWQYNLEIGCRILDKKFTPSLTLPGKVYTATDYDTDRSIIENWYYAVAWYNGTKTKDDPSKAYNYVRDVWKLMSLPSPPYPLPSIQNIGNPQNLKNFPNFIYAKLPSINLGSATEDELISNGYYTIFLLAKNNEKIHRWDWSTHKIIDITNDVKNYKIPELITTSKPTATHQLSAQIEVAIEKAIQWAKQESGKQKYLNYCYTFVSLSFQQVGVQLPSSLSAAGAANYFEKEVCFTKGQIICLLEAHSSFTIGRTWKENWAKKVTIGVMLGFL